MSRTCNKCGFVNTMDSEFVSKLECPKCGAVYDKVDKSLGLKKEKFTVAGVDEKSSDSDAMNMLIGLGAIIVGVYFLVSFIISGGGNSNKQKSAIDVATQNTECMQSLPCWAGKQRSLADVICKSPIQRMAKYDVKWGDGVLESIFSNFRWRNQSKGEITFVGDKVKFQNGFGAWQNSIYECDIDPETNSVLDVRIKAGHL